MMGGIYITGDIDWVSDEITGLKEDEKQKLDELAFEIAERYGLKIEEALSVLENAVIGTDAPLSNTDLTGQLVDSLTQFEETDYPKNREQRRKEARLQKKRKKG